MANRGSNSRLGRLFQRCSGAKKLSATTGLDDLMKFLGNFLDPGDDYTTIVWITQLDGMGGEFGKDGNLIAQRIHQQPCDEVSVVSCNKYIDEPAPLGVRRAAFVGINPDTVKAKLTMVDADTEIKAFFLHELGHTIGLCHCNDASKPNNLMKQTTLGTELLPFQANAFSKGKRHGACDVAL